jgi:sugar lactone lactonase YvrE
VVILVRPDGAAEIAAQDLVFPNGCVVADEGRSLIVAESLGRRFARFRIGDDGALSDRTAFAECGPYIPDGMCIDADGAVWAAMTLANEFQRIAPGGEILQRVAIGDRFAVACTLGGPDLRTLFLLTAREHSPDALAGTMDATIHVMDVDVPGTGSP